ncbi:PAAR domain-containing protein [Siccirubricoccus soli]
MPLTITVGVPTVLIGGMPAATVTSITQPCMLAACVPGGPGMVAMGSATVLIGGLPAARVGDMTAHAACVAVIPMPTGKILPPGCPTVMIGG